MFPRKGLWGECIWEFTLGEQIKGSRILESGVCVTNALTGCLGTEQYNQKMLTRTFKKRRGFRPSWMCKKPCKCVCPLCSPEVATEDLTNHVDRVTFSVKGAWPGSQTFLYFFKRHHVPFSLPRQGAAPVSSRHRPHLLSRAHQFLSFIFSPVSSLFCLC